MTHHQALQDIIEDQVIEDKNVQNVIKKYTFLEIIMCSFQISCTLL